MNFFYYSGIVFWVLICLVAFVAIRLWWIKPLDAEDEQCPVCGYYCLGKGGVGCIDKPSLVEKGINRRVEDVDEMDKPSSIHSGNITVANGLRCSKCGLIRPSEIKPK